MSNEFHEVPATSPPIVSEAVFERAQELLKKNRGRYKPEAYARYPFVLSGVLCCGVCHDTMAGKSAHGNGGKFSYYDHGWAIKRQAGLVKRVFTCNPQRVNAKLLEPLVWKTVLEILHQSQIQKDLLQEAKQLYVKNLKKPQVERVQRKLDGLETQLEALSERLAQLPKNIPAEYI